jgi:hypothetical protein
MSSTSETGHGKNIAHLGKMLDHVQKFGAVYNPSNPLISVAALTTLETAAKAAMEAVQDEKAVFDKVTNEREIAFDTMKARATQALNNLASSNVTVQTMDDAKTHYAKIVGKKAKTKKDTAPAEGQEPWKSNSTSQQSYDMRAENFTELIKTLTSEPKYAPNEPEITIQALIQLETDLDAKNAAAVSATTNLSNARIARGNILYKEITGLHFIAKSVKSYVKGLGKEHTQKINKIVALKFVKFK